MIIKYKFILLVILIFQAGFVDAAGLTVYGTKINLVVVNGGVDSPNRGTTCLKVSVPISTNCQSGFLAIPSNNKELLSAVLMAKASGSNVYVYYEDTLAAQHCPGQAFTSCIINSIGLE